MRVKFNVTIWLSVFLIIFSPEKIIAKKNQIDRVDPPFWWVDMQNPSLELLVYGPNIAQAQPKVTYPGVHIHSVVPAENPNYLFVTLHIAPGTTPGTLELQFQQMNEESITFPYELRARQKDPSRVQGLSSEDFIYLLFPDRFANGDSSNDVIASMNQEIEEGAKYQRHGGDIQGIENHLDYLEALGVTALWINPLTESDQPHESYHGYAITDHYEIDARFGTNEAYRQLVEKCHQRGIKVIMDIVLNHVGNEHWLIKDLPARDWVNQWDEFTKTTYRAPTLLDPYASAYDKQRMSDGWFDTHMPDLNQRNPHVARYLTQNNLWWIEYAGIDAFRIDTYAYPDQAFNAAWAKEIRAAYPKLHMFAETWVHGVPVQAFFTEKTGFQSQDNHMPAVTDFQLHYALNDALTKDFGWTEGLARLYYTLAKDVVYHDATRNVVFLDNHDLSRYYAVVKEDLATYKMGIGFLLTTRGIPCMYYGTEVLLGNYFDWGNHESVRQNFPGGFADGQPNKFREENLTEEEKEAFHFVQTLANYRKQSPALKQGKLMQFVPEEGVYVYFRYLPDQTVMVVMNQNAEAKALDMARYVERTRGFTTAKDVLTGESVSLEGMQVKGRTTWVLELKP